MKEEWFVILVGTAPTAVSTKTNIHYADVVEVERGASAQAVFFGALHQAADKNGFFPLSFAVSFYHCALNDPR